MRSILISTVCLFAFAPGAALAQQAAEPDAGAPAASTEVTDGVGLADIVVTARKREENLQSVPATISAISSDELVTVGIKRIDDIGMKVTGLNLARTQTNTINAVIRGVGSFRNVNGVGFYFDDIQEFSAFSQGTFDVEHIEVLKGPQGTLYGGLNVGGAIKYVFKQPEDSFGANFEATVGDHGVATIAAGVTGPLSPNISARVSGYFDRADGMFTNVFNGKEIGGKRDFGGRIALLGDFDRLQVYFQLRGNKYRTTRLQTQTNTPTPKAEDVNFEVYAQDPVFGTFNTIAPTLKLDYELGDFSLTSLSAYSYTDGEIYLDSANTPPPAGSGLPYLPLVRLHRYEPENVFQQEVRVQSPVNNPVSFILGASYLYRTHDMHGQTDVLGPPPTFTVLRSLFNENEFKFEQYAGFGTVNIKLSDRLQASVGLRVNRSVNTFTDFLSAQAIVVDGNRVTVPVGTPIRAAETNILPRVDLSYHLNPDVMFYGSFSQGVNPAGAAVATSSAAQPFGREKTTAYEIGVKSELFDRKLRFNLAAFFTDYTDRTFTSAVNVAGGASIRLNNNIGDSRNLGFEAELTARPLDQLTLSGGVAYVSSEWKKGTFVSLPDLNLGTPSVVYDISGLQSPATPRWSGNAAAEWTQPLSDRLALTARADMSFMSGQYWDLRDSFKSEPYALINAQIGLEFDGWKAFVQVRNLTDRRYNLDWLPRRDTAGAVNLGYPGDRRTIRLTITGKI